MRQIAWLTVSLLSLRSEAAWGQRDPREEGDILRDPKEEEAFFKAGDLGIW